MENELDYKNIIMEHHKQGLGASDGDMIARIAELGYVPSSYNERLAIIKGLYDKEDNPTTEAMRNGDDIEMQIFDTFHSVNEKWESNKYIESKKFSRKNCTLFCHIDFFLKDDEKKVITFVECKATSKTSQVARRAYINQLYLENILGKEYTASLGSNWKFSMKLCHYNTKDYNGSIVPEKIEKTNLRFGCGLFNIGKTMDIISSYLDNMTEFYKEDIEEAYLPEEVKHKFEIINTYLTEIKEREDKIKEFKERMFNFMNEKNIKSIKTEMFSITKVEPTEMPIFDKKKFEDEHRVLYKKYLKKTKKKGFALLRLKNDKNND